MAKVAAQQWAQDHLEHVEGEELRRSVMCGWNGDESDMGTRTNKKTKAEYGSHQWFVLAAACAKLWGVVYCDPAICPLKTQCETTSSSTGSGGLFVR